MKPEPSRINPAIFFSFNELCASIRNFSTPHITAETWIYYETPNDQVISPPSHKQLLLLIRLSPSSDPTALPDSQCSQCSGGWARECRGRTPAWRAARASGSPSGTGMDLRLTRALRYYVLATTTSANAQFLIQKRVLFCLEEVTTTNQVRVTSLAQAPCVKRDSHS